MFMFTLKVMNFTTDSKKVNKFKQGNSMSHCFYVNDGSMFTNHSARNKQVLIVDKWNSLRSSRSLHMQYSTFSCHFVRYPMLVVARTANVVCLACTHDGIACLF